MTLSSPIARADFADLLGLTRIDATAGHQREYSGLGNGQIVDAQLAPSVRRVSVTTKRWNFDESASLMALIEAMESSSLAFELYDPRMEYPPYDPDGSILGANTVTILDIDGNNRLKLAGAPEDYELARGCFLSWDFGDDDEYRAYHRMVEPAVFDGSNETDWFEVRDFMDPGSVTDIEVTLIKPCGYFKIMAGSVRGPNVNRRKDVISFDAYQVFEIGV